MRVRVLYILSGLLLMFFSCSNENNLPEKIKNLPNELIVTHIPSELYAEKDSSTGYYYWRHQTSVTSPKCDAKIVEFGAYAIIKDKWTFVNLTHKPYGPERFEIWYSKKNDDNSWSFCDNAILKKGITYTDVSNYSLKDPNLIERHGLWYYIAKKDNGELIMGYAKFHANPEIKK